MSKGNGMQGRKNQLIPLHKAWNNEEYFIWALLMCLGEKKTPQTRLYLEHKVKLSFRPLELDFSPIIYKAISKTMGKLLYSVSQCPLLCKGGCY